MHLRPGRLLVNRWKAGGAHAGPVWLLLTFLWCLPTSPAGAAGDEDAPDPIDRFYDACIARDGSTAGMVDCTRQAASMWDAEMNKVYHELLARLGPAKSRTLREAQRAWVAFRDQEFQAIGDLYSFLEGTVYIPAQEYSRLRLVKERTLLLRHYLSLIESDGEPSPSVTP